MLKIMKKDELFSNLNRNKLLEKISKQNFDLLVVGGGITGAGIALDAASRGLSVCVVEKDDFASGTSSRSTKLVHGGLRYLEHLELGLVHEVGREREIVHNNAPHIVIPEKMILPIIEKGSLGEFTTSLALFVYDYLAGVKKEEHRKMLTKEEVLEIEPLIDSDILKGGALYYEYKTDDSRLTVEVLKKAVEYGADAYNYLELKDFIYEDNKVIGGKVFDKCFEKEIEIRAKYTVNATGAWVDKLRAKDNSLKEKSLHHTKGIHIVVPKSKFNLSHSIYFDVGDNRMIFAIPRFDIVYIGTTDTDFDGNLDNPDITNDDVKYLIDAVNRISPKANLSENDVVSAWSGLRPLIHEDGKAPSELSRKDEIFYSKSGLISIAGGKLTGYRMMAKKVVDIVRKRFKTDYSFSVGKCITKGIKLAGGEFKKEPTVRYLVEYADMKYDEAKETGISIEDFKKLFYRYGTNIDKITNKAYDYYSSLRDTESAWIKAEVWYCVNYEMVSTLTDFFIRRTGMIHFYIEDIEKQKHLVADELKLYFDWDEKAIENNFKDLEQEIKWATEYK